MIDLNKVVIIDTETTGLIAGYDEILQLSIIDGNGNVLFNQYMKPGRRKKWDEAQRINHISPDSVKDKPTFRHYREEIQQVFDAADAIIGYNAAYFDMQFLAAAGILFHPGTYVFDVMHEFAPIYGEWNDYFNDYKWQKLTTCARYYKYDSEYMRTAHDALADCYATLHCFKCMVASDLKFADMSDWKHL